MKELLNTEEKRLIASAYGSHPLYKLVRPCKQFEVGMPHLKFSPEEVFAATVQRLSELGSDSDDTSATIRYWWDDMVCRYRERCDGQHDDEVALAVSEVFCALIYCLGTQTDDPDCTQWIGGLSSLLTLRYPDYPKVIDALDPSRLGSDTVQALGQWVETILYDGDDEIKKFESLLDGSGTAHSGHQDAPDSFPLTVKQAVILYSHLLKRGIAVENDNYTVFSNFIEAVTPYKPKTVRTAISQLKKNISKDSGQLKRDALKVAEIVRLLDEKVADDILQTYVP